MTTRIMGRSQKPPDARKTPQQERSRQTRLDLLSGATRVLQQRGSSGLTTNHVAEKAGVSVGSFYQYYPNKAALLADLHEEEGVRLWEKLAPALRDRARPFSERLLHVLEQVFLAQAAATEHHAALEEAGVDVLESDALGALRSQFQATLEQILVDERNLPPEDAQSHAAFAVTTIVGLLIQLGQGAEDAQGARALASHTARMLSAYLGIER